MARVQILDDHLVNMIAAGEVVARPASAVKELLENSLDAGATRIEIEFDAGGQDLIRVIDDGEGMSEEDALAALQRHATSKIRSEEDLQSIRTLGFRGEAVPSIAAVSKFEILTRTAMDEGGTRVRVDGGRIEEVRPSASTVGTTITVKELFFNTPARRKFLKSEATEARHLIDTVSQAILAHPDVSFKLSSARKPNLLSSPGTGKTFDAIVSVLGPSVARGMLPVPRRGHPEIGYAVSGHVSRPDIHRGSRAGLHIFVNDRPVQSPQLSRVVANAYQAYLPRNRWPLAVLFIEAEADLVDVNVHPQKLEVRLSRSDRLASLVGAAIRDVLAGERRPETVVPDVPDEPVFPSSGAAPAWRPPARSGTGPLPYMPLPGEAGQRAAESLASATAADAAPRGSPFDPEGGTDTSMPLFSRGIPQEGANWENMHVIGQVFRTFIVGTSGNRIYFIDQHTAHERVLYEGHVDRLSRQEREVQQLLIPVTVDCPGRTEEQLEELVEAFQQSGFDCGLYSSNTLVVKGVPIIERGFDVAAVVQELLEEAGGATGLDERLEYVARTVSCRAAVKAGDRLSDPEMSRLVKDLGETRNPLRCPHGRPVLLQLDETQLKKLFERNW